MDKCFQEHKQGASIIVSPLPTMFTIPKEQAKGPRMLPCSLEISIGLCLGFQPDVLMACSSLSFWPVNQDFLLRYLNKSHTAHKGGHERDSHSIPQEGMGKQSHCLLQIGTRNHHVLCHGINSTPGVNSPGFSTWYLCDLLGTHLSHL